MNNYFGLSFVDIINISKEFNIPESSLYFSDIKYITEKYNIDVKEIKKVINKCIERENEHELER